METKMQEIGKLQNEVQKLVDESSGTQSKEGKSDDAPRDDTNEQSEIATTKFMEKLEGLQDKWDAISQILEAQSQRVSITFFLMWCELQLPLTLLTFAWFVVEIF